MTPTQLTAEYLRLDRQYRREKHLWKRQPRKLETYKTWVRTFEARNRIAKKLEEQNLPIPRP